MGGEMLEMGVNIRKVMIFSIRRCYRSVRNHPFLVGLLCLLVLLYRSSPFVFSLLVSVSPVLVCTAVLLGTLLSFGQPNIPEIEREEKINHEIASLRTGVSGDVIVVEQDESYSVERVTREKREAVEQLSEGLTSVTNRTNELHRGDSLDSAAPLIVERSREMGFENEVIESGGSELNELGSQLKNELRNVRLGGNESMMEDDDLGLENDESTAESFDSERVNVDSLDSPPDSPWKHVEEREEQPEDEEEDEADDSGSDRAESSSPDASMADIIPMLDELHPLLDENIPLPFPLLQDGSDAASERSPQSSECGSESDDNIEKHEELEDADGDNEDVDDDDEAQESKEGQTKSCITWTEEDQKNLMDLGSSELERNQRLESLIVRRRSRKTMSLMPEKNLIDLDSFDLAFNVAPISTSRNNPFDQPHDSYDNMGLPPIPGSAPSIMSRRRNPFDLPYDSTEEKPDLMGDSFQQEFKAFQPKEPFFRRHESFNIGPSFFGPGSQDRQESRFRPYFVPERTDSEGTGYSPSLERQYSGLSDSKASSVPETDSVVSVADTEDKNLMQGDTSHPEEMLNSIPEIELRSPTRELEDENPSEEDVSEEPELILKKADRNPSEEDIISPETELISKIEDVSEKVGHGSQSSDEADSSTDLGEVEKIDNEAHSENHQEVEQIVLEESALVNLVERDQNETHLKEDQNKLGYRSASSSSSLSEASEKIFCERDAEVLSGLEENRNDIMEDSGISRHHSLEESDFGTPSVLVGETSQKEPVYDTSPPAGRKNLSSPSSISSNVHVESEMGFPPVLIKRTVSFAEKDSESSGHEEKKVYDKEILTDSSQLHPLDENQSEPIVAEVNSHHILKRDSSQADEVADTTKAPVVPESTVNHASVDSTLPIDIAVAHDAVHGVQHQSVSSEDQNLAQSEEQLHMDSPFAEQVLHRNFPSTEDIYTVEHSVDKEVAFQPEHGQTLPAHNQFTSEERAVSGFEEELVFLDKSIDETSSRDTHEVQEQSVVQEDILEEEQSARDNINVLEVQELEQDFYPNTYSPTSPESISVLSEAFESRVGEGNSDTENNTVNEFNNAESRNFLGEALDSQVDMQITYEVEDEIREIDEVLLSELDTVGDFSVKEYDSRFDAFEKHVSSGGESSSVLHVMEPSDGAIETSGASDIQHSDISSGNLIQGEIQSSTDLRPAETVRFPSENEIELENSRVVQYSDPDINVDTPVVEARSVEDIESMFRKAESSLVKKETMLDGGSEMPPDDKSSEATSSGMPALEARILGDIDSVFKPMNEKETKKPNSTELAQTQQVPEETNAMGSSSQEQHQDSSVTEPAAKPVGDGDYDLNQPYEEGNTDMLPGSFIESLNVVTLPPSELLVMESRSLEDVHVVSEGHLEKEPESNSSSKSREAETNEEGTSGNLKMSAEELDAQEISQSDENLAAEVEKPVVQPIIKESNAHELSQSDKITDAEIEKPVVQSSIKEPNAEEISRSHENIDAEVENPDVDLSAKGLRAEVINQHDENSDAKFEKPETSTADTKGKRRKSNKSSSSSSSSSDSSSSDSDKE